MNMYIDGKRREADSPSIGIQAELVTGRINSTPLSTLANVGTTIAKPQQTLTHNMVCFLLKPHIENGLRTIHIHLSTAMSIDDMFDARIDVITTVPDMRHITDCFHAMDI